TTNALATRRRFDWQACTEIQRHPMFRRVAYGGPSRSWRSSVVRLGCWDPSLLLRPRASRTRTYRTAALPCRSARASRAQTARCPATRRRRTSTFPASGTSMATYYRRCGKPSSTPPKTVSGSTSPADGAPETTRTSFCATRSENTALRRKPLVGWPPRTARCTCSAMPSISDRWTPASGSPRTASASACVGSTATSLGTSSCGRRRAGPGAPASTWTPRTTLGSSRSPIQVRVPALADPLKLPSPVQRVQNLTCQPRCHRCPFRQLPAGERFAERWQQATQSGGPLEEQALGHTDQLATRHDPTTTTPGLARHVLSHLKLICHHDLDLQVRMGESIGDADQLAEHVQRLLALGRPPACRAPFRPALLDPLGLSQGHEQPQPMTRQQRPEFGLQLADGPGLDLDQEARRHHVDDVAVDRHLEATPGW